MNYFWVKIPDSVALKVVSVLMTQTAAKIILFANPSITTNLIHSVGSKTDS